MRNEALRTCHCGKKFWARAYSLKRGWGKSCSKKCAAKVNPNVFRKGQSPRPPPKTDYTPEVAAQMLEMRMAGNGWKRVARQFGTNISTASRWVRKYVESELTSEEWE